MKLHKLLAANLLSLVLLLGGCESQSKANQNANSVKKVDSKVDIQTTRLKKAIAEAKVNRPKFQKDLEGVTRQDESVMKEDLCLVSINVDKKIPTITFQGLITNTTYSNCKSLPSTTYRVFIEKVFQGDRSKEGSFVNIKTDGGKIESTAYYKDYPEDKEPNFSQLSPFMLVRINNYDPAAPGDEIILSTLDEGSKNGYSASSISSDILYRPQGQTRFSYHHYQLVGQQIPEGRINAYKKMKEGDQKSENEVNLMTETRKVPKRWINGTQK